MPLLGKLLAGRLTDISSRDPVTWADGGVDVPLAAQPAIPFPWSYDAVNQVAIPAAVLTVDEKTNALTLPQKVLAALALRQSASWATLTALQQSRVQAIIDAAGAQIVAALT